MLQNRHFISYFSTTLLYVTIITAFFYLQQYTKISTQRSEEKVMQVRLTDFMPELPLVEETPLEKEVEEPEERVEEVKEPEPIKEEKVEEEVVLETIIEPLLPLPQPVTPKPVPKMPEEKPKKVIKKLKEKPEKRVEKKKPVKKTSKASSKKSLADPNKVSKFHQMIRKKIDQNKFYPKIAKRRGMQGAVKVSFTILANGQVSDIRISGPKVFHSSARHAVKSAFPISVKNAPVLLPTTIHIPLRYQIR